MAPSITILNIFIVICMQVSPRARKEKRRKEGKEEEI
jgi:hypothetical protein